MRERRVLYTVEEAANLLGISPSTVHRWARESELRTIPLSGRVVVPGSSLEQLLGNPESADPGCTNEEEAFNQVAIAGRLVSEAAVRASREGLRYATMRLAVAGHGPSTEPFQVIVVAFANRAEDIAALTPGALVRIDGRLAQRRWTADDGARIGAQQIVAERIRTLDSAAVAS